MGYLFAKNDTKQESRHSLILTQYGKQENIST